MDNIVYVVRYETEGGYTNSCLVGVFRSREVAEKELIDSIKWFCKRAKYDFDKNSIELFDDCKIEQIYRYPDQGAGGSDLFWGHINEEYIK